MTNKKRLIDANALLEDFGEEPMVWNDGEAEIQERNDWRTYTRMVQNAPTVDAVEVVHGEWRVTETIPTLEKQMMCSACRCIWYYPKARWNDIRLTNYCPNCGAKMDGDGNA